MTARHNTEASSPRICRGETTSGEIRKHRAGDRRPVVVYAVSRGAAV